MLESAVRERDGRILLREDLLQEFRIGARQIIFQLFRARRRSAKSSCPLRSLAGERGWGKSKLAYETVFNITLARI
jgi:hypothetical protein